MDRTSVSAGLLALILAACAAPATSPQASAEEHAVYAALLSARWASVVLDEAETKDDSSSDPYPTLANTLRAQFRTESPPIELGDDILAAFASVRAEVVPIDPERLDPAQAKVVPPGEIQAILGGTGDEDARWKHLRDRYGPVWGIVWFSRVAFSKDGTRALVAVSSICGDLCGYGTYVLLEKTSTTWRELASVTLWVS